MFNPGYAYVQGTPVQGQPMMTAPQNMQYMATPPHGQVQMSTPNQYQFASPQQSPGVPCFASANECLSWVPGFGGVHPGAAQTVASRGSQQAQQAVPTSKAIPMPSVVNFDKLIREEVKEFQEACTVLGGPVEQLAKLVHAVFKEQRAMLDKATKMKRPGPDEMHDMLAATEAALHKVEDMASEAAAENPEFKNHLQMIAGAVSSMGWVTSDDPKGLISDALNAIPVFAKYIEGEEGEEHKAVVRSLKTLLRSLRAYADKYHNAGLAWNSWNANAQLSTAKKAVDPDAPQGASGSIDTERARYPAQDILGEFDSLLRDKVVPFVQAAYGLGGEMVAAADCVQQAFKAQRDMLEQVTACRRPGEERLEEMLEATSEVLGELAEFEEAGPGPFQHHLKLVSNGMTALAWVSVELPVTYVTEVVNSLPVFSDKVLKEAKARRKEGEEEGADLDTQLVTHFRESMRGLLNYIKQWHAKGLHWNPNGKVLT
mmetsp:Transcript_34489/g.71189  ORF Transcript_34489/g.71189 Transcript_34489/m.71189 type:complete len:486 (-) Transcript_34489:306-1763(-)